MVPPGITFERIVSIKKKTVGKGNDIHGNVFSFNILGQRVCVLKNIYKTRPITHELADGNTEGKDLLQSCSAHKNKRCSLINFRI